MTEKLIPTIDSLAAYLIADTAHAARQDPTGFLQTVSDIGTEKLAELTIVDEFDVPDDMYWLYDLEDDDPRLEMLFDLRNEQRLYDLLLAAVNRLTEELT